jgi:glyoxylase-like metal-dependent hydrolase (beta-lactamase superfamily II)
MHTALLVSYRGANVMIDAGLDWLGKLKRVDPSAIVLTHAHPDHAWGLKRGAPCPVYAPQKTWQAPAQTKKTFASTAKYPAFAKRGKRVQAFFV